MRRSCAAHQDTSTWSSKKVSKTLYESVNLHVDEIVVADISTTLPEFPQEIRDRQQED